MQHKKKKSIFSLLVLLLMLVVGFVIRLVDLDDPPLDFNPTRQLRSAIIARGIYYQSLEGANPEIQSLAISHRQAMEKLEPPIVESIIALFYRLMGSEELWIAKVISTLFWSIAAVFLYDLGRRMGSEMASLIGVAYFLFLPFGIQASRAFQPDPLLVMCIMISGWTLFRWNRNCTWKWLIIAGISGGLTGLVKPIGLLFVGGMTISIVIISARAYIEDLGRTDNWLKNFLRRIHLHPRFILMLVLIISPLLLYYLFNLREETSGYLLNWTVLSRWQDVLNPSFFMRWMILVDNELNLIAVLVGFLGLLLTNRENRIFLFGVWSGYFLLGILFPHHILTHDYYHLPLVGIVSLSVVPFFQLINSKILEGGTAVKGVYVVILFVTFFYNAWLGRSILLGSSYRDHPTFWREVGNAIPLNSKAIGITQDYGFRLIYYGWRKIEIWPQGAEVDDFERITAGADFFVITAKNLLKDDLENFLEENYPVFSKGDGYIIYDMKAKRQGSKWIPFIPNSFPIAVT